MNLPAWMPTVICAVLVPLSLTAAPLSSSESAPGANGLARPGAHEPPPSGREAGGILDRAAAPAAMPGTTKTIEMLLELQQNKPGLEGGEAPKREPGQAKAAPPVTRPPPFGAPPALGAGELPAAARRPPVETDPIEWTATPGNRREALGWSSGPARPRADSAYAGSPPSGDGDDLVWLVPRSVIRFVRQNRDAVVVASFAVLALVWAGAGYRSRRRK